MNLDELLTQANNALGRGEIVIEITRYDSDMFNKLSPIKVGPSESYLLRRATPREQERRVRLVIESEQQL